MAIEGLGADLIHVVCEELILDMNVYDIAENRLHVCQYITAFVSVFEMYLLTNASSWYVVCFCVMQLLKSTVERRTVHR